MSKCIYKGIAEKLNKDEVEKYFQTHTAQEVCEHFGFHRRYLYRILHYLNIEVGSFERYSYINKNYVCTEERNRKVALGNTGRTCWNKGLTKETDERLKMSSEHSKGHPPNRTSFKKGNPAWNKGTKGLCSWTDEQRERFHRSIQERGWYQVSAPEEELYEDLVYIFSKDNVIREYMDKERYPFHVDFYIKSEDMFIELNRFWHHGPHPFNSESEEDMELLSLWESKSDGKNQYAEAIKTWTQRDVRKIQIAKENNLNYVLIY